MSLLKQHSILTERIKNLIRTSGPKEPEELLRTIQHRLPPIVPFTVSTMLFTGNLKMDGFGRAMTPEQFDDRPYEYELLESQVLAASVR